MKREQIIAELERLAEILGVEIRYEKMGVVSGGLCKINDALVLLVNKNLSPQSKIELIASELKNLDWSKHFVKPEVREILERA
ncbi:hypothetical protein DRQ26_05230 [bacterium]|nr:MAG: hypothetical protein DRQ26_05230 [bacterium]